MVVVEMGHLMTHDGAKLLVLESPYQGGGQHDWWRAARYRHGPSMAQGKKGSQRAGDRSRFLACGVPAEV
jgi:hypothetical protein